MACRIIVQCTTSIPLYIRNHVRFILRVYPAHVDFGVCDAAGAECTSPRCNAEARRCRSKSGRTAASTSTDLHYLGHGTRAAPTPPSTPCAIAHVGRRYWSHACTSGVQGDVDIMAVSGRDDRATHVKAPLRVPDAAFSFIVHTRQPSSDIHRTRTRTRYTYVSSPRMPRSVASTSSRDLLLLLLLLSRRVLCGRRETSSERLPSPQVLMVPGGQGCTDGHAGPSVPASPVPVSGPQTTAVSVARPLGRDRSQGPVSGSYGRLLRGLLARSPAHWQGGLA